MLKKILNSSKNIIKPFLRLSGILSSFNKINYLYKLKNEISLNNANNNGDVDNINDSYNNHSQEPKNISESDKQSWLKYSKSMLQKSNYAILYLVLIILWTIASIAFMFKQSPFWVFLLQFYFIGILVYYFIMCRYRSYQGLEYSKSQIPLIFKLWINKIFNKKINK